MKTANRKFNEKSKLANPKTVYCLLNVFLMKFGAVFFRGKVSKPRLVAGGSSCFFRKVPDENKTVTWPCLSCAFRPAA